MCVCAQTCASSGKGWLDEEKVRNAPHFPYCSSVAAPKISTKRKPGGRNLVSRTLLEASYHVCFLDHMFI